MAQNQRNNQQQYGQQQGNEQFISEPVEVGLPWRLMIFTFVLLLFAIFIFVGLRVGYMTYLDNQIAATDQQMEDLASQVSEGEKERFLTFYSQLVNLQEVLDRRRFSQNIFGLLENNTLPQVFYDSAEYGANNLAVLLSGRAATMQDFVDQMVVYDQSDQVEKAILDEIDVNEEGVDFTVNLLLGNEFLSQPISQ